MLILPKSCFAQLYQLLFSLNPSLRACLGVKAKFLVMTCKPLNDAVLLYQCHSGPLFSSSRILAPSSKKDLNAKEVSRVIWMFSVITL